MINEYDYYLILVFLYQLFIVMIRSIVNLVRDPMTSFVQVKYMYMQAQ